MEDNAQQTHTTHSQVDDEQVEKLENQIKDFERVKDSLEICLVQIDKFMDVLSGRKS